MPATGRILHHAVGYDLLVWLMTLGRPDRLRERFLALAGLESGDRVLDIGCGTGGLAIAAARRVGPGGRVCGIDASPEMIRRAAGKARRAGVAVAFQQATAEALPFADGSFDLVLSTVMLHHLPKQARRAAVSEARRTLRPGGRVLVVDFGRPSRRAHGLTAHFHRRGRTKRDDVVGLMADAGLRPMESGEVGFNDLWYLRASRASSTSESTARDQTVRIDSRTSQPMS